MSTFRHPVGSQPANVYWRRRAVVGIGALVVIVVILLIVFAPKGGGAPAAEESSAAPSSSPTSSAAPAACDPANLSVTATTDKSHYATGEMPQMSFTITNNGPSACTVTAGSDVQEFVVSSGKEKYWDSKDCQTSPQAATAVLESGASTGPNSPLQWSRTRSSSSACDGTTQPQVTAGGATYSLKVTVDGVTSKSTKFILD